MRQSCLECQRPAVSCESISLCRIHFKSYSKSCKSYHLTHYNSPARKEFNQFLIEYCIEKSIPLDLDFTATVLRKHSHKYCGGVEITRRLKHVHKYFGGKLNSGHFRYCLGITKKVPKKITGDEYIDIVLACFLQALK